MTSSHSILRNESVKKRCCATTAAVSSAENIAAPTKARAKSAAAAAAILPILWHGVARLLLAPGIARGLTNKNSYFLASVCPIDPPTAPAHRPAHCACARYSQTYIDPGCMLASSDAASCQRRTTRSPTTSLRNIRSTAHRLSHPAQLSRADSCMPAICPGRPCNGGVSPADSWQRPSTRLDSMPCTLIREPATSRWMPPCCIAR